MYYVNVNSIDATHYNSVLKFVNNMELDMLSAYIKLIACMSTDSFSAIVYLEGKPMKFEVDYG